MCGIHTLAYMKMHAHMHKNDSSQVDVCTRKEDESQGENCNLKSSNGTRGQVNVINAPV